MYKYYVHIEQFQRVRKIFIRLPNIFYFIRVGNFFLIPDSIMSSLGARQNVSQSRSRRRRYGQRPLPDNNGNQRGRTRKMNRGNSSSSISPEREAYINKRIEERSEARAEALLGLKKNSSSRPVSRGSPSSRRRQRSRRDLFR